jgi:hypothetical protein
LALWPAFLGMEIGGQFDDKDDTANAAAHSRAAQGETP